MKEKMTNIRDLSAGNFYRYGTVPYGTVTKKIV